jgi:Amt family ammonium transporter
VKNAFGYDDALDVFGVHCIGGIIGAILTGVLVDPSLGGTRHHGLRDRQGRRLRLITQVISQCEGGRRDLVWSGIGTLIILKVIDVIIGLRADPTREREGLDLTDHGERAYNM